MPNTESIKTKICELIRYFNQNKEVFKHSGKANTETKLIEQLFSILGWTIYDFTK